MKYKIKFKGVLIPDYVMNNKQLTLVEKYCKAKAIYEI